MPKLLVLFESDAASDAARAASASTLAESVAAGARTVRFTEVDVRAVGGPADRITQLESAAAAREYDGIVLVATKLEGSPALNAFVTELASDTDTSNVVFAVAGPGAPALLAQCAAHPGIIAATRATGDAASDAKSTGAKAAKVAGWVRHALGHEAEHGHGPSHVHDHAHKP